MSRLLLLLRDAILAEVLWHRSQWHTWRHDRTRAAARRHLVKLREFGERAVALGEAP